MPSWHGFPITGPKGRFGRPMSRDRKKGRRLVPAGDESRWARAIAASDAKLGEALKRADDGGRPKGREVTFADLKWSQCRWPLGAPGTPEFRFCGFPKAPGRTRYCEFHRTMSDRNRQNSPLYATEILPIGKGDNHGQESSEKASEISG